MKTYTKTYMKTYIIRLSPLQLKMIHNALTEHEETAHNTGLYSTDQDLDEAQCLPYDFTHLENSNDELFHKLVELVNMTNLDNIFDDALNDFTA